MPNETVTLNAWEASLASTIQAKVPGIQIATLEEERALDSICRVAQLFHATGLGRRDVHTWSAASCWRYSVLDPSNPVRIGAEGEPSMPPEKRILDFLNDKIGNKYQDGILVLFDPEPLFERNYGLVRLLRESLSFLKGNASLRKTIILVNEDFEPPSSLRPLIARFTLDLLDVQEIYVRVAYRLNEWSKILPEMHPDPVVLRAFATACSGLTEGEVNNILALAVARTRTVDERAVALAQNEKARILLRGGALGMSMPKYGFDQVGGLENAKAWAHDVTPILEKPEAARKYGLKIPSGLLLVGIPGAGKSLLCEALAKEWRLPLLKFDVGACFGSLVGESEKNIRRMIEMAMALRPCMVFIDEIEKGLGGDSLDGGTSSRVKQTLLTWLQEKPDTIFVCATANDLTRLETMPELIRSGRFDEKFFVDLPNAAARQEIFKIHFRRAGHEMPEAMLLEAAGATRRYSGAEIECVVQQALRFAFKGLQPPTEDQLLRACSEVRPLADTMAESIARLRNWCRDGRAKLAGQTLEEDSVRVAVRKSTGLPFDMQPN